MNSLDFLHIALGGGFILLVIFFCVLMLQMTLVLRDILKITTNFKDISDRIREAVYEPLKVLSELSAGFTFIHSFIEKIRARYESGLDEEEDNDDEFDDDGDDDNEDQKDDKKGFSFKKLSK